MLPVYRHLDGPPIVTIVVPCYNAIATLDATAASILAQTDPRWEAVFVDDGSTDGTLRRLKDLAKLNARIRWISGPHRCPAAARNVGVSEARSDWILFLDADDLVRPSAVGRLLWAAENKVHPAVISAGYEMLSSDGRPLRFRHFPRSAAFEVDQLLRGNHVPPMALVPRSILLESPLNEDPAIRGCEDWDLWLKLAARGMQFIGLPVVLFDYRLQSSSLSHHPDQMFAAACRVLHAWLPRAKHAATVNNAGFRAALACGAVAAAQGNCTAFIRYLEELPDPRTDYSCGASAASTIHWAYAFVHGAAGRTWETDGSYWLAEIAEWLATTPIADLTDEILIHLHGQQNAATAGVDTLFRLLDRRPDARRVIVYGLGANGLTLLEQLQTSPPHGRRRELAIADDYLTEVAQTELGFPLDQPGKWRQWPRDTVVIVTPNEADAMCHTLQGAGGIEGRDFVVLGRSPLHEPAGAA